MAVFNEASVRILSGACAVAEESSWMIATPVSGPTSPLHRRERQPAPWQAEPLFRGAGRQRRPQQHSRSAQHPKRVGGEASTSHEPCTAEHRGSTEPVVASSEAGHHSHNAAEKDDSGAGAVPLEPGLRALRSEEWYAQERVAAVLCKCELDTRAMVAFALSTGLAAAHLGSQARRFFSQCAVPDTLLDRCFALEFQALSSDRTNMPALCAAAWQLWTSKEGRDLRELISDTRLGERPQHCDLPDFFECMVSRAFQLCTNRTC